MGIMIARQGAAGESFRIIVVISQSC